MSALNSQKAREVIEGVLLTAALAQVKWAVGDISAQHAGVRLADKNLFKSVVFFETGYKGLDMATGGGFAAGECSTVFGPAGIGKTVLIVNLALNAANFGTPVGIISLEMNQDDILKLIIGIAARIKRLSLRHMNLSTAETGAMASFKHHGCQEFLPR